MHQLIFYALPYGNNGTAMVGGGEHRACHNKNLSVHRFISFGYRHVEYIPYSSGMIWVTRLPAI